MDYYQQEDVVFLAKDLIGKVLCTNISGKLTKGIITETEAYNGVADKACHAYGGRRTTRTEIMFQKGGSSYIYLCYGIHHLFNIVTSIQDDPKAVLIRSIKPLEGIEIIRSRRGNKKNLGTGPGVMSTSLGLHTQFNNTSLESDLIWLEDHGNEYQKVDATPRIGIDYAGDDALLPYRFVVK